MRILTPRLRGSPDRRIVIRQLNLRLPVVKQKGDDNASRVEVQEHEPLTSIYPHSKAGLRRFPNTAPLFRHTQSGERPSVPTPSTKLPIPASTQSLYLRNATDDLVLKALYRRLGDAADRHDAASAIEICKEIYARKQKDRKGSLAFEPREKAVFIALLRALADNGLLKESRAVHADMIGCGFQDCIESRNYLLKAAIISLDNESTTEELDRIAELPNHSSSTPSQSDTSSTFSDLLFRRSTAEQVEGSVTFEFPTGYIRNWDSSTCAHLIHYACQHHSLEYALVVLSASRRLGQTLPLDSYNQLIDLCLHLAEFRTAAELANLIERGGLFYASQDKGSPSLSSLSDSTAHPDSIHKLAPTVWLSILRACASGGFLPGVELAWQRAVIDGSASPDEGTILMILALAAKEGSVQLATACLKQLDPKFDPDNIGKTAPPPSKASKARKKFQLQEWHLASLYEAQCTRRDFVAALRTLLGIQHRGMPVSSGLARRISTSIYPSMDHLDKATDALYEIGLDASQGVSMTMINAVLSAAVWLGARDKALEIYDRIKTLYTTPDKDGHRAVHNPLRHKPDTETFNVLLSLCIDTIDVSLGNSLLKDLNLARRRPDVTTYERMIVLCLTNSSYEDVFGFLTEAKTRGIVPSRKTYEAVIRKCYDSKDSRWKRVAAEMEFNGYPRSSFHLNISDQSTGLDPPNDKHALFSEEKFQGSEHMPEPDHSSSFRYKT